MSYEDDNIPGESPDNSPGSKWLPEEAFEAMVMERTVHPSEDNTKLSKRLITENAPVVTQSLIHLAIHSSSERIRLDAAKYLTDRLLGRVGEEGTPAEDSPISEFLKDVISDIEELKTNGVPQQ